MKLLLKLVLGIVLLLSLITIQGCPECLPPEPKQDLDSDIIFTGQSLNSPNKGIFIIREDGNNLQELIENAEMYSGISDDGKFVFLERTPEGKDRLVKWDFYKGTAEYPFDDTTYQNIRYPVRSKDGKYIAFFTGDGKLVSGERAVWVSASYDICPGTLPVFSPDSKLIAFIEADSVSAPFTINIVRADNPGIKEAYKLFPFGLSGNPVEVKLGWNHQDLITYSYTRNRTIDVIGVWNHDNPAKSIEFQQENLGAFNPVISPDKTKILFTSREGTMWWRNYSEDITTPSVWVDIGKVNDNEYIAYPQFSKDGKKILFTRFFRNDSNIYSGKLEMLVNFGTDSVGTKLICNRVNRAFWRENK
jgi:hypothetical protein